MGTNIEDFRDNLDLLLFLPPAVFGYLFYFTSDILYLILGLYLLVGSVLAFDLFKRPEDQEIELTTPVPGYLPAFFTTPWIFSYLVGPILLYSEVGTANPISLFLIFATLTAVLIVLLRNWRRRLHEAFAS